MQLLPERSHFIVVGVWSLEVLVQSLATCFFLDADGFHESPLVLLQIVYMSLLYTTPLFGFVFVALTLLVLVVPFVNFDQPASCALLTCWCLVAV
jgi:hypothetical protein